MKLTDIIIGFKILTGRHLSKGQMENARPYDERHALFHQTFEDGAPIDGVIRLAVGYERFQQTFKWDITNDVSYGEKIKHHGYYPEKTIDSIYDDEGRLKSRFRSYGSLWAPGMRRPVTKIYVPAGRIMGKKQKD